MRNVLMIVYYFPPLGSVQVIRSLKFVKYLPQFNWQPIVLAVKEIAHFSYDYELLEEIPPQAKVYRTGSLDPFRVLYLLTSFLKSERKKIETCQQAQGQFYLFRVRFSFFNRYLAIPDSRIGWLFFAVRMAMKILKSNSINLIYSVSPPNTCHLVGYLLKKQTSLPWVADFKDVWLGYPNPEPNWFNTPIMNRLEKKIIMNADKVICVSPKLTELFKKKYPLDKFETIPNGFDESDFFSIRREMHNKFTISYVGNLTARSRSPVHFLNALKQIFTDKPELAKIMCVQFIGPIAEEYKNQIQRAGLADVVEIIPPVSHKSALQYMVNADVLLLLEGKGEMQDVILPAKLFEYLASRRPILALLSASNVASEFIHTHKAGLVVDPDNELAIKEAILEFYSKYESGTLSETSLPAHSLKKWDRKQLTADLAAVFNSLIEKS